MGMLGGNSRAISANGQPMQQQLAQQLPYGVGGNVKSSNGNGRYMESDRRDLMSAPSGAHSDRHHQYGGAQQQANGNHHHAQGQQMQQQPQQQDDQTPDDYFISDLYTQLSQVIQAKPCDLEPLRWEEAEDPSSVPMLWVSKWVDYSDKYGLGYQLCDESVGVLFNDSTRLILCSSGE